MFDSYGEYEARSLAPSEVRQHYDPGIQAVGNAVTKFHSLHWRACLRQLWGKLLRRPHRLLELNDVRRTRTIESMHEMGSATVEVRKIRGSEGRSGDFDDQFLPLKTVTQQRWAGIYAARLCGQDLAAVQLVQVGDTYYVRDGHHRVSVARQLGEEYIDANVSVWQVRGEPVAEPAMTSQFVTVCC